MPTRLPACFLIAAGCAAASGAAVAADPAQGPYGQVAGGGNHQREQQYGEPAGTAEFDEGGLGTFSLGYAIRGWRPELELGFRRNEAENDSGTTQARTGMANLWYDFPAPSFMPRLRPYLGGGAGEAQLQFEQVIDSTGAPRSGEDNVFAWQAGAGLNYDATRSLVLSLGYRFLETDTVFLAGTPPTGGLTPSPGTPAIDERYRSDGVLAGLRYVFGGRREQPPMASAAPAAEPQAEVAAFETVILRPVNFQHDRAELTEPSRKTLDELAARLKSQPDTKVLIEGYADATGSEQYNLRLGQRRADSVRDYLVGKGVQPASLQVASRGEAQPVADNASPEGRAQNRRTEVNATEQGDHVKIVIKGPTEESLDAAKEP